MQPYYNSVQDAQGNAVAGASVTIYLKGTSTKASLFSDNGTTALANPVISDGFGQIALYAANARYSATTSKIGITTQTIPDFILFDPADAGAVASSSVTFTPSGTGAITSTVAAALQKRVHTSEYDTNAHYLTARNALTGTFGVYNFDACGTAVNFGQGAINATANFTHRYETYGNVAPFSISTGGGTFNGVYDDVFYWGYNTTGGSKIVASANRMAFSMEADYFNAGVHGMEFNLDWNDAADIIAQQRLLYSFFRKDDPRIESLWRLSIGGSGGTGNSSFSVYNISTGAAVFQSWYSGDTDIYGDIYLRRPSGTAPAIYATGTNLGLRFIGTGSGRFDFLTDGGTCTAFVVGRVASAVNNAQITGGSTGNGPQLSAQGETNVDFNILSKGNGRIVLSPQSGDIMWNKALVALGGGAAPTLGTIGGSGPASAAQNSWMRVADTGGVAFWVPAWK